ncbi:MAG: MurR/RpiR family transcriptional regulator [Butyrivibrio sp.]
MHCDVLEQIKESIPNLSKSRKKIAHYIIENLDEAAFLTAAGIGNAIDVSESTVVRFASAMGYEGFPEFQQALAKSVRTRLKSVDRIDIESNMSSSKIIENVLKGDAQKILSTMKELDGDAFNAAVDTISKAEKVYIVGVRSSAPLAEFLGFYLRMIVDNVVPVTTTSSSEIFEQMIHLNENDVVIGISFPRYSMRTLKAMEFANNRNAKVIALTDSIHSPMNLYSSCNLFARSDMASVVDSLVAPLSLINALIVALSVQNSKKVVRNLEKLNEVWEDYQLTNNDEINYLGDNLLKDLKGLEK